MEKTIGKMLAFVRKHEVTAKTAFGFVLGISVALATLICVAPVLGVFLTLLTAAQWVVGLWLTRYIAASEILEQQTQLRERVLSRFNKKLNGAEAEADQKADPLDDVPEAL